MVTDSRSSSFGKDPKVVLWPQIQAYIPIVYTYVYIYTLSLYTYIYIYVRRIDVQGFESPGRMVMDLVGGPSGVPLGAPNQVFERVAAVHKRRVQY